MSENIASKAPLPSSAYNAFAKYVKLR